MRINTKIITLFTINQISIVVHQFTDLGSIISNNGGATDGIESCLTKITQANKEMFRI